MKNVENFARDEAVRMWPCPRRGQVPCEPCAEKSYCVFFGRRGSYIADFVAGAKWRDMQGDSK